MWSADLLAVNPDAKITVETIGEGKHRVVLVDDFYQNPMEVAQVAMGLFYFSGKEHHGNFPGARALISLDTRGVVKALGDAWGGPLETYQRYAPAVFSVINNANVELNIDQRMPHIDPGVSAMVYLNPPELSVGGTGIYRHTLTGLERVPIDFQHPAAQALAERYGWGGRVRSPEDYTLFQDSIVFNPLFATRENEYINDGNDFWELLYLVEMRFNRLVIFDGRMPHSQFIRPDQFTDHSRLNQILYLKGRDPG